ncbi:putative UDP-glucuronate decarboxylase [Helianthus annuus]|nr:putative UDP-glucuronate decarboxylase [Helianthus annuus]KAJ0761670.1 putative UDP-glucuronate decarboxylase [Helianthus annuus]
MRFRMFLSFIEELSRDKAYFVNIKHLWPLKFGDSQFIWLVCVSLVHQVDGHIRLTEGNNTGPINLGNPGQHYDEFTMLEVAENVKEVSSGSSLTILLLCPKCP